MRTDVNSGEYSPHIDGLRAIAVIAVIVYHLDASWLPGGFVGVDVFFVISGFVVSASLARSPDVGVWPSMMRFYARRLRRIMPALVTTLLTTAVLSTLLIPESWLSDASSKTGRMAFVGLSNWVLAKTGSDYFSPRTDFNPYAHTWSLGVEEQFYLVFPLLFLAWAKSRSSRWLSLVLLGLATGASLVYAVLRARQGGQEIDAFYLTATRFWQLGAGVLLFQVLALAGVSGAMQRMSRGWGWWSPLLLASSALLGYAMVTARPGHSPWIDGLWPVIATLGLLGLLHWASGGWTGRGLSSPPLVMIGRLSYSLYLWHWPVFVLFRWSVGLDGALGRAAAVVCTVILAWLSWRFIEQPFRFGARWRTSDTRWVVCGVAVLIAGAFLQSQMDKLSPHVSLSSVSRHPQDWYPYAKGLEREYPDCSLSIGKLQVAGARAQLFERGHCPGAPHVSRQVFVAGDSHALNYTEMLRRYVLAEGGQVRLYGFGGCALVGLQGMRRANPPCEAYSRNTLEDIARHAKPGDVLFLPGLRTPRLAEQYMLFDTAQVMAVPYSEEARAARQAEVAQAIAELMPLAERGVHVVLEAPKPLLQAPPYRCSDVFNRSNPICARGMSTPRAQIEHLRAPALAALQEVAAALPSASIWDPLPLLCSGSECLPSRDGHPLFFDGDHLSGYANRHLLPSFRTHLASTGPAS
jgi:peptidoglycan/LPS O-acetylase OafA/YrhL